ncbi:MAG: 2,3-bisphosphoglycerate-independent phosphoglycerate mutase [Oscillospiraceae bacterium]|nr:2,3-bisphosphoglycerate-independent phosphoglycerate mutase [Oscillospiraceae bacterium]
MKKKLGKPLLLAILDGYGYSRKKNGNAILNSKTPNLDRLTSECPTTLISASGLDVGLPEGQIGNSEVGHTNIGAGRVVYQGLTRITKSIEDGDFFSNPEFLDIIKYCQDNNKSLHIMGLISNGGVHSHLSHLYGLLKLAKDNKLKKVYLHCFTDGRDVDIKSADGYIFEIEEKIKEIGVGKIATVIGRYFAMDRDNRWDRVQIAYSAMVNGEGEETSEIHKTIKSRYDNNQTDEFLRPIICDKSGMIKKGDSIIFFNFRPDRARQITRAFVDENFDYFKRDQGALCSKFVCMTQYDETITNVRVAFKPLEIKNSLTEYLSKSGFSQLHIAETEKYAHVTFFFSGGVEKQFENEDRELIPSPAVATYDLAPKMSADQITDKTLEALDKDKYDIIILNFANCDMVGHTGSYEAAIEAVETVDKNIKRLEEKIKEKSGVLIITSDHGNAEEMIKEDGVPMTAHTTNPVIFTVVGHDCQLRSGGRLGDIAPTILDIINLKKPSEMTGESLIIKN